MKRTRHFTRHFAEMVAAMFIGMGALGVPAVVALAAAGATYAELRADVPALLLLGMAVTMTVPMVAWMRHRGHARRRAYEMAAAMFVPTLAMIALLGAGAVTDFDVLLTLEHVVMIPAMLIAMLLRLDEYAGAPHAVRAA